MFCVVQEIETKKAEKHGYAKELKTSFTNSTLLGRYAWHYYSEERFERPVKKAYRISIHKSYREKGKVHKRQFAICTANYYDLATERFCLFDWGNERIQAAADALQVEADEIYDMIRQKLQPVQDQIIEQFRQTEEYRAHQEHERITTLYAARKTQFNEKYGTSGKEYDQCYDVFGNLHTPGRLKELEKAYKSRKKYEKQSFNNSRRYYEKAYDNYTGGSRAGSVAGHEDADRGVLKQFYRELSKKYHPDANPDKDTSEQMKVLNQLKSEWGL